MVDVKQAFTRKLGPLPVWGWGLAIGGGYLAYRAISGGGKPGEPDIQYVPTGPLPTDTTQGFIESLSGQLAGIGAGIDDLREGITVTVVGPEDAATEPAKKTPTGTGKTPTGTGGSGVIQPVTTKFDLGSYVIGLRQRFPSFASLFGQKQTAGETSAERNARLTAEKAFIEAKAGIAKTFDLGTYVIGLRKMFPSIAAGFTEVQKAGETAAQRTARLTREREYIESRAGIGAKPR